MSTSREEHRASAAKLNDKRAAQQAKATQLWNLIQGNSPATEASTEGEQK